MTTEETKVLAAKVKAARIFSGYTQKGLADKIGLSKQIISAIENGTRKVMATELLKMIYVANMTLLYTDREMTMLLGKDK